MAKHAPGKDGVPMYGLDKDVQNRIAAKYDMKRVAQCCQWIKDVTGKQVNDFHADLKNGVTLCKLMNKIQPKSCKPKNSKMPFVQRENIVMYLEACKKYGMRETDLFVSQDLFEGDNLNMVLINLLALNTLASKKGFKGPFIGQVDARAGAPKQVDLVDRKEQKRQDTKPGPPPPPSNIASPPKRKPPTGPGLPNRKPPTIPVQADDRKLPEKPVEKAVKSAGKPKKKKKKTKSSGRPKKNLKRMTSKEQQQECRWWIETITGNSFKDPDDFHGSLKDGVLLCQMANKINPKKKARFKKKATMPFVARENIAAYIDACKRIGVSEHDLFVTGDLYEGQSMKQVVTNIFAVSAKAREKGMIDGPFIGAKIAQKSEVQDKSGWLRDGGPTKMCMGSYATRKVHEAVEEKYVNLDNIIKDTEHLAKVYGPKKKK